MKSSKLLHQWSRLMPGMSKSLRCRSLVIGGEHRLRDGDENKRTQGSLRQSKLSDFGEKKKFRGLDTDFPCRSRIPSSGEEPIYDKMYSGYRVCRFEESFGMKLNKGVLPELEIAYETWGELNKDKSNVVLISTALPHSSHAKSHKDNPSPGWWEKFIGPGCAIDTDKFFVVCSNLLGSCYGTTGPSSINPMTNEPYGTTFPLVTVDDMVKAKFKLLDHLGVKELHSAVGVSLGGMCSLVAAALYPERVNRVISISASLYTYPTTIGFYYIQRKAIMMDPNWNKGHYYGKSYPKMGMKLARELATITLRSGSEWKERFGRKLIKEEEEPSLCPHFMVESYIEHRGESISTKFDPNSLLYISKALDLFDISEGFPSVRESVKRITCPVMVLGVQTDMLTPCWQQKEIADELRKSGNDKVTYYELDSVLGHDAFLVDLGNVGGAIKGSLESKL